MREEARLTQLELAKILKINNSTLSQYETGTRVPSDDIKIAIANHFSISLDYLLGRTDQKEKPTPVSESGPLYPPEYDMLNREDKEIVDNLIRSLAEKKSVD